MADSTQIFLILGLTLAAFAWGRFRYDLVALAALLATTLTGLVPANEAFLGFGHPAVITVAAVLVLSRGFERSGACRCDCRADTESRRAACMASAGAYRHGAGALGGDE